MNRAIKEWASYTKAQLSPEIRLLINQATADLYAGPTVVDDDEETSYPGFRSACNQIRDALDVVIFNATIEDDDGNVLEIRPRDAAHALLGELAGYVR